jgi:hypothetical protein
MRGIFIYPPTKTYCSIKYLWVLNFFIYQFVSTCLIEHHMWQLCINKIWHVASRHLSSMTAWSWRLKLMTHDIEALIYTGACSHLAKSVDSHLAKIVGSYLTKIVISHLTTNWHRRVAMVDQWIYTYMNHFVDIWLSHVMINMTSGYKWESEKP